MKWILIISMLFFAACGKNEAVRPVGNYTPTYPQQTVPQAPPPMVGGGQGYPTNGNPYFVPNMPAQMPNQFYPWLPMYQYFQQQPQTVNIWINVWAGWQGYAQQRGYNRYDFNRFWFDYCPEYFPQQYYPVYQYFDQNVYYWMNQNTYLDPSCDASYFWANYSYMSYQPAYDYCDSYCY